MPLPFEGWLPQAEALGVGKQARVEHDCGPGSSMIVSNKLDKFTAWCFRCGEGGVKDKVPTLADQVELRKLRSEEDSMRTAVLPQPMEHDIDSWPIEARVWLYKAGLSKPTITSLGIYYHPPTKRVVLPIVEAGHVTYWQARAVMKDQQPKYINPSIDRDTVLPRYGSGPCIVLTEDYLSAVRVGQVTEAWSLLGTDLKQPVLAKLLRDPRPVVCWLDPDSAGEKAMRKIKRSLHNIGKECHTLHSIRDPKLLSKREITKCLQQFLSS